MSVQISKATRADFGFIAEACRQHIRYEQAIIVTDHHWETRLLDWLQNREGPDFYVVISDENRVGYLTLLEQHSTFDALTYLYLDCLYLMEAARGKGTGQQIMNWLQSFSVEAGYSFVEWQTPQFNHRAIKFYLQNGAESAKKARFRLQTLSK